ncbi:MAG: hypothetical protein ACTSUN_00245 [Promethearchaeota archaeon]
MEKESQFVMKISMRTNRQVKKRLIFGSTPVSSNDGMIEHFVLIYS